MLHLTACKISVNLSFLDWVKNKMIIYCISELMLATLFRKTIKNHFISRTRDELKFYRLSDATFYDCINTTYQFINIKPFSDNKMSTLQEYRDFNQNGRPYMVKHFLQNLESFGAKSWYISSETLGLPILFNWCL